MKISWESLISRIAPALVACPFQFTRAFNSVKHSFGVLLPDHSPEVLSTVYTARNLH